MTTGRGLSIPDTLAAARLRNDKRTSVTSGRAFRSCLDSNDEPVAAYGQCGERGIFRPGKAMPLLKFAAIALSSLCLGALASSDALAKPKKQTPRAPAAASQTFQSRGTSLSDYERIRREDAWMARASRSGGGGY